MSLSGYYPTVHLKLQEGDDMFHKILVALDYSDISRPAIDEAIALAKSVDATLMLLHVLSPSEEGYPNTSIFSQMDLGYPDAAVYQEVMQRYNQQWQEFEEHSLKILRSFAREAEAAGVAVDMTQYFGSPGSTICTVARLWDADLIVIGRRGHSGLPELFLGSVSNYVLHHAPCSVLTVQGQCPSSLNVAQNTELVAAS
jgi:nucleotide-binding universal stress UspA family protein